MHGFWYFEAERSFRQVAALDPDCAMAYWGMAMANANNEKRAKAFIEEAVKQEGRAPARAKSPGSTPWPPATPATDNAERRRKYVRDLEALVQDDPNDIEAKAFLALQIWKNGSWMTESKKHCRSPATRRSTRCWTRSLPSSRCTRRITIAFTCGTTRSRPGRWSRHRLCGQSSPGIAHMWHMPGHTYSKLHRYADAAWQQEASARVDHAHMMRDRVLPDQIHNYAHNNEWLIRNLAFLGRVRDAIDLAKNMIELPRHPKYNTLDKSWQQHGSGITRLIDVLVQYERWAGHAEVLRDAATFEPVKDNAEDQLEQARHAGAGLVWSGQRRRRP